MTEVWKTISYAPNYEISSIGRSRNKKSGRILKINYERLKKYNKRVRIAYRNNNNSIQKYLHRVVAEHFIENINNYPEVNHISGDYYDNSVKNLEWITRIDNMKHASQNNLIKAYKRPVVIIDKITHKKTMFEGMGECCEFLKKKHPNSKKKYSQSHICQVCRKNCIDKLYHINYLNEEKKITDPNIIWKEYPEANKYEVSTTGEVRNKKTLRIMMGGKQNGYRFVTLVREKGLPKLNRLIHRMVAQTYLSNPENKKCVNHKDTNILNNSLENLEWVSHKENMSTIETRKNLKRGKENSVRSIILINVKNNKKVTFESGKLCSEFINIKSSGPILNLCHYYNSFICGVDNIKIYKKQFAFLFVDSPNVNLVIEDIISNYNNSNRVKGNGKCKKRVAQIDKHCGKIINTFDSGYAASKELNIHQAGVSQCCLYHSFSDSTRPVNYKLKYYKGYMFKFL